MFYENIIFFALIALPYFSGRQDEFNPGNNHIDIVGIIVVALKDNYGTVEFSLLNCIFLSPSKAIRIARIDIWNDL